MSKPLSLLLRNLATWFERQKRVLPWRDDPSLYRVWVSEIMLQQTQVITVVPYFEKFISRFPTVEALAEAAQDDVLLSWAGLGYYSRARNLHKGARAIVASGDFPRTREDWLEISGVGEYTAGAILSIALNQPEAILDGNVERVLSRFRRISRGRGDAAFKARLWRLSRIFVSRAYSLGIPPSVLNQALMELGATVCTFRKPQCHLCPLASSCRAHQAGEEEAYPPRKKPKQWVAVQEELHALVDGRGRVFLRRRSAEEWRAGLWDLLDLKPSAPLSGKISKLGTVESRHIVTRHKITRTTHFWLLSRPGLKKTGPEFLTASESGATSAEHRWISIETPEVAVGSALKKTLQLFRERFPEVLLQSKAPGPASSRSH